MLNKLLIWASLIIMVLSYNTWVFTISSPYAWLKDIYFEGMALGIFLLVLAIYRITNYIGSEIFLGLAFSNLMDEMFFNPKEIGSNEYIVAAITILFIIYKYKLNSIKKKYNGINCHISHVG